MANRPKNRVDLQSHPHSQGERRSPRDQLTAQVLDALWAEYRDRVPYVRPYESIIAQAGARFVNDHVAFRTIASQRPMAGIASVSRIFEALGYQPAGTYLFPDKHLASIHFQHPLPAFPKLFISELRTWELGASTRRLIAKSTARHAPPIADKVLADLSTFQDPKRIPHLVEQLSKLFRRPWPAPERRDVLAVNEETQFGAWVLLHGYAVNHFTALVNSHQVAALDDIDKTVEALRAAGVPMKSEIEGARGSKLRQTATEAAVLSVPIQDRGKRTHMPWTYAYFEIAERGDFVDPETGQATRFEGFLGPQATQLFEMTRVRS